MAMLLLLLPPPPPLTFKCEKKKRQKVRSQAHRYISVLEKGSKLSRTLPPNCFLYFMGIVSQQASFFCL